MMAVKSSRSAPADVPSEDRAFKRRPLAPASRIAIFEREVREHLSRAAIDALITRAELLSEGQTSSRDESVYVGSTMLTLDLGRCAGLFREACDVGTARRLAAMLTRDTAARNRIRAIATREAERITRRKIGELTAEIRVTASGARVLVDVDVEARL